MRVALIVARDFIELDTIREVVLAAPPETLFVIRDGEALRDHDAPPPAPGKMHKTLKLVDVLAELRVEPEIMSLDPEHKWSYTVDGEELSGDHRSQVRDEVIKRECDRVLVFRTPSTKTLEAFRGKDWIFEKLWPHVRTIERGKAPKKSYRKARTVE